MRYKLKKKNKKGNNKIVSFRHLLAKRWMAKLHCQFVMIPLQEIDIFNCEY